MMKTQKTKKNNLKLFLFIIWFILTILIVNKLFFALSIASTLYNVLGFLGLVVWGIFSFETKCFTKKIIKK
jgi:hypothetical protein